ncbi:hypothetical protein IQ277_21165 [Nostocales cyanobacterium LEGE 12452]|nr:hypothetical protein [Nostocales cyanobacterium LEGE 12452]
MILICNTSLLEAALRLPSVGICGLIVSQPDGFRLRSTLSHRELSAVETRFTGTLFLRKFRTSSEWATPSDANVIRN